MSAAQLSFLYGAALALPALAAPLAAQSSRGPALSVGFAATLGAGWQIEGGEVAYVRRRPTGLLGGVAAGIRLGAFVDQGAIIGGTRGFVVGGTLAARTGAARFAEFGDDRTVTALGVDLTLEVAGYLGANSPLPFGSRWATIALLPGLRAGGVSVEADDGGHGPRYAFVIGPALFVSPGAPSELRGLLALRVEAPLARAERLP